MTVNHDGKSKKEIYLGGGEAINDAANRFLAAAVSLNTRLGYESDLRHFLLHGLSVPASVQQVVEYLIKFADKLAVGTLERRLVSLHKAHMEIESPSPVRTSVVKGTMAGIRRIHGKQSRQARPFLREEVIEAVSNMTAMTPLRAARNTALLLIAFAGAFRRSEIVGITVEHIKSVQSGLEIVLLFSKTDQERRGRTVFIPYANGPQCPVKTLRHWLNIANIDGGFIFRAVNKHDQVSESGLTPQSVSLIVKSAVARLGGDPSKSSGHSLRA